MIFCLILFFTRFYFVKLDRESINNHLSPHVLLHEFDPYQILFTTKIKFMRVGVKLQLDEGAILKKKYWQLFLLNRFELRLLWIFAFNPTNTAWSTNKLLIDKEDIRKPICVLSGKNSLIITQNSWLKLIDPMKQARN